jgi:hypothetical protein
MKEISDLVKFLKQKKSKQKKKRLLKLKQFLWLNSRETSDLQTAPRSTQRSLHHTVTEKAVPAH